jgi:hypothetical protein
VTKEEIIGMKIGKELNIRVAEDVMGCKFIEDEILGDTESCELLESETEISSLAGNYYGPLRHYSQDNSVAQEVINKLKNNCDARVEFNYHTENWEAAFSDLETGLSFGTVSALDAPEAICKAALLAILQKEG